MRILHTADWHLGDRLGRIDRTEDLRRAVERVALYCQQEKVDVVLVAGDLFSELAGAEGLREAIRHLQQVFADYLGRGGTILSLTGNHDKETFCQTLQYAMGLAAPMSPEPGTVISAGRFYLATAPTLLRLLDPATGLPVQFVLMPYPTAARYLTDAASQRYSSLEEKNRQLMGAFSQALKSLCQGSDFDPNLPTVLSAHIHVRGGQLASLFRISAEEDVVFEPTDLPHDFDYVALGHIHRAQSLMGQIHIRYSGSIERMDLGEAADHKGVVLIDLQSKGVMSEPVILPLETTPIYTLDIRKPAEEIPLLVQRYPNCQRALVQIRCTYRAGVDNREELLRELERTFPRWYDREIIEASNLGETLNSGVPVAGKSFRDTVREYLHQELIHHDDTTAQAVLNRVDDLLGRLGDDSTPH